MSNANLVPRPLLRQSDTPPPKIVDLKIYSIGTDPNDTIDSTLENIMMEFTYSEEVLAASTPTQFLIESYDMVNDVVHNSILYATTGPYYLFTNSFEKKERILNGEESEIVLSNYRIQITPMNDSGNGPRSIFFVAHNDIYVDHIPWNKCTYLNDTLSKYWHLFSETPNNKKNRPKVLHIYLEVEDSVIENDKAILSNANWNRTCIGDWVNTNAYQYRWSLNEDGYLKKLTYDNWWAATAEEEKFIQELLRSIRTLYLKNLVSKGLNFGDNVIFKTLLQNPLDKNDSIILYVMKGLAWEL
jgi:hypothetical protein